MVRLQKIIFPSELDSSEALYYRSANNVVYCEDLTATVMHHSMRFDTYFNMFSLQTWKIYTYIERVSLEIRLKGKCRIRLYALDSQNHEISLAEHQVDVAEMTTLFFPFPESGAQMLFWTLEQGGGFHYEEAWYASDVPEDTRRDIRIAVVTCTFKREEYLRENIRLLHSVPDSYPDLEGRMTIHIVDNGRTLSPGEFERTDTFLYPNPNVGGAGGFTRGIIEALDRKDGTTHIMLMDDDVRFLPESLFRTLRLLEFCRPEYHDAFLGGAMLDARIKHRQHESSAALDSSAVLLQNIHDAYDLTERRLCLLNDTVEERPRQYQGWWCCLFPARAIAGRGLPYPFFLRFDDAEFGVRKPARFMYLNGICLWHDPFYAKKTNSFYYQHFRNVLIFGALHFGGKTERGIFRRQWARLLLDALLTFNYQGAEALADAVEDFLGGPEQLKDPAFGERKLGEQRRNLETDVPLDAFRHVPMPADLKTLENYSSSLKGFRRLLAIVTLNGNLLPPFLRKKETGLLLDYAPVRLERIYRCAEILIINRFTRTAKVRKASCRKFAHAFSRNIAVFFRYLCERKHVREAYRREYPYMTGFEFWRGYLGMTSKDKG